MRFVVLSVLLSVHPLADVGRTVLKPHALRLATPEKPNGVAIRQPQLSQVQNDVLVVAVEKLLQLRDLLSLHTPT